jgi:hypothetical protein
MCGQVAKMSKQLRKHWMKVTTKVKSENTGPKRAREEAPQDTPEIKTEIDESSFKRQRVESAAAELQAPAEVSSDGPNQETKTDANRKKAESALIQEVSRKPADMMEP